jgi:hypothetical protein
MCQYFFWPAEKGSRVMFYEDYLPSGQPEAKDYGEIVF